MEDTEKIKEMEERIEKLEKAIKGKADRLHIHPQSPEKLPDVIGTTLDGKPLTPIVRG